MIEKIESSSLSAAIAHLFEQGKFYSCCLFNSVFLINGFLVV